MSITIHHGSNGSYKTSGVIQDYFIDAALAGRHVVTNIRGVSRSRTLLEIPDTSEKFEVTFIDTETKEGRWLIATWFHWVPPGALLLFDEAGVMFPKVWRATDIAKLDFPGGVDAASAEDRPAVWSEAWEMHRHWNWDIVLSVPNIKLVRDDIRLTTEGAFKHKNKALLGPLFKGYKEGYHDAQKNGTSIGDFDVIRDKRITDIVFRLYDSTKTGKAQSTLNGFNMFTSPRFLLAMGVAVLAFGYAILSGGYNILFSKGQLEEVVIEESVEGDLVAAGPDINAVSEVASDSAQDYALDSFKGLGEAFNTAGGDVANESGSDIADLKSGPLSGKAIRIAGGVKAKSGFKYSFEVIDPDSDFESIRFLVGDQLVSMGYRLKGVNVCNAILYYEGERFTTTCISSEFIASR